jgi:hypothetical protein
VPSGNRIGLALAVIAATVSAALAAGALAHTSATPTSIVFRGVHEAPPEGRVFTGQIFSATKACVRDRKVRAKVFYPDASSELFDVARTSREGSWAVRGPVAQLDDAIGLRFTVKRRVIRKPGHEHVCGPRGLAIA